MTSAEQEAPEKTTVERETPVTTGLTWAQRLKAAEQAVMNLEARILQDWNDPQDNRVKSACDDAKLLVEFIARYIEDAEVSQAIRSALRQDMDFVEAFEMIHGTVDEFGSCLAAIGQAGAEEKLLEMLDGLADELRQWLEEAVTAFVVVVNDHVAPLPPEDRSRALQVAADVRRELRARQHVLETRQARDQALHARDETKKVAGDTGASKFAQHYSSYADSESLTANRLRWAVAVLLVAVALVVAAFNARLAELSLGVELLRLSVTIPIAVLATYLVRESSKHRANAIWARELAIAMHTISSYTEPLGKEGIVLRRVLGLRAFGASAGRPAEPDQAGLYDDLEQAVTKAEGILHRVLESLERRTKS